jgi:hypothetical protein
MSSDAWPSPDAAPAPLPRIEDLPLAEQGYDQESVRLAFDSFYRHAAQLDASLRALEAVEVFRRDADALRNDLRALRALGLGGGSDPGWTTPRYDVPRSQVSAVVVRLAAEAALIVAVAVIAGVANFRPAVIIVLMAGAFVIVAVSEWLAARARFVPPPVAFLEAGAGEPAPYVEAPAPGWEPQPALEPGEDTEPDALTMIVESVDDEDADDEDDDEDEEPVDPWEPEPAAGAGEEEPELVERGGFFRRRRR